jgi:succinoglycan biosynthesis transport protein ExoP
MADLALTRNNPRNLRNDSREETQSTFSLQWILHVLWKRRWLILTPLVVIPLAVVWFVLQLPDQYTSGAVFALIQPQVSKQYVDSMTDRSSSEMIRAVTREVLAVPRLSGIVESFGLFAAERGRLTPEQLGERLRESIDVAPVDQANPRADYTAFRLAFTAENAKLAQQVLSQLASLFVEVNLKERGSQAQTTTTFLKAQMDLAKQRMDRQEQVLLSARMSNMSQNPAANQARLGVITDLRMQLQNSNSALNRLAQQRASVETTLNASLARLQNERNGLLKSYTQKHPTILQKDKDIAQVQNVLASLKKGAAAATPSEPPTDPVLAQLATQIETNSAETQRLETEAKTIHEEINRYQSGMSSPSPAREQEVERAQRDYDLLKQEFADRQAKYFRSQMTADLVEAQSGQNFRLVDPPTLPALPSGPKRLKISLGAIGVGLVVGLGLAFLLEMRRNTFLREADLRNVYHGALVIGMPVLTTRSEDRWRRARLALEFTCGAVMIAAVSAAEYYIFRHG